LKQQLQTVNGDNTKVNRLYLRTKEKKIYKMPCKNSVLVIFNCRFIVDHEFKARNLLPSCL